MASTNLFHLLAAEPVVTPPDAGTIISATTPDYGVLTTHLLDPALPAPGYTQVINRSTFSSVTVNKNVVLGRWLSRKLPAQTIGSGNWALYGALRDNGSTAANLGFKLWGFTVAQWRDGTGVVARFLDAPTGGTETDPAGTTTDIVGRTSVAGVSLTLSLNDCLIVEVWCQHVARSGTVSADASLLYGGIGQYVSGTYTYNTLLDTDLTLLAPVQVTYS